MSGGRSIIAGMLLTAAVAGLGYGNWQAVNEAIDTTPIMPPVPATPVTAADPTTTGPKTITLNDISETVSRPLFMASRRPAPPPKNDENTSLTQTPPPPAPSANATPPANLRLIGTMKSGDTQRKALIQVENSQSAKWLDVGADAGGWRVSEIAEDHVVVEAAGARSTLLLHPSKGARTGAE